MKEKSIFEKDLLDNLVNPISHNDIVKKFGEELTEKIEHGKTWCSLYARWNKDKQYFEIGQFKFCSNGRTLNIDNPYKEKQIYRLSELVELSPEDLEVEE